MIIDSLCEDLSNKVALGGTFLLFSIYQSGLRSLQTRSFADEVIADEVICRSDEVRRVICIEVRRGHLSEFIHLRQNAFVCQI